MSLPRCPVCKMPVNYCRCGMGWNKPIDVSFQCYACPSVYIFNGNDEQRIPRTVAMVNEELKEIRGFYWYLLDMTSTLDDDFENLIVEVNDEDLQELKHLTYNVEIIHQVLAPLFINEDVDGKDYDDFMKKYTEFKDYIKNAVSTGPIKNFKLNDFYENMVSFAQSIQNLFNKDFDVSCRAEQKQN